MISERCCVTVWPLVTGRPKRPWRLMSLQHQRCILQVKADHQTLKHGPQRWQLIWGLPGFGKPLLAERRQGVILCRQLSLSGRFQQGVVGRYLHFTAPGGVCNNIVGSGSIVGSCCSDLQWDLRSRLVIGVHHFISTRHEFKACSTRCHKFHHN